jgi:sec-independent protein translocase protein TatB
MFGIDFSEILVIFVIALVVLGPERLPKLAATIGKWLGRARAMARQFREQLEQEASRIQHETKNVQDSVDLNAAVRRATQEPQPASSASNPSGNSESPSAATPTVDPVPTEQFGLHNAGAPEPAGSPEPQAPAAAKEPAAAVEAHER